MNAAPRVWLLLLACAGLTLVAAPSCRQALGITDGEGADAGEANAGDAASGGTSSNAEGGSTSSADAGGSGNDASANDAGPSDQGDAGAVCTETTCTVTTYQSGLYGPVGVAVDTTHVYWIEVGMTIPQADQFGQLVRLPKVTTCKTRSCYEVLDYYVIAGELEGQYIYDTHLALNLNDVCYTQSYNASPEHSIKCVSLAGTLPERGIEEGAGDVVDLWIGSGAGRFVVDSSKVGTADGVVYGSLMDAGTTTALAPKRLSPSSVTSDGTLTYFTELGDASANGAVDLVLSDGGAQTLFGGRQLPVSVRVFGGYLYWIDQSARRVMRGAVDGTGTAEQIATTDEAPFQIAVDSSGVYIVSAGTGNSGLYGSVARAPLTPGGAVTTMMSNIDKVTEVALDATSVYIASTGTKLNAGQIVFMPKTH